MNLAEAIRGRRAVRDFTGQPVTRHVLNQLVAAASWAPSATNEQPWHFTVVTDQELLRRISASAKLWNLSHAPEILQTEHFRDLMGDPDFQIFYNAPVLVVISVPAGRWASETCAMAAQNLMLAAVEKELGTCWIGFAQSWLESAEGCQLLGIPEGQAMAPIILGHPRTPAPPVPRKQVAMSWIGESLPRGEA